MGRKQREMFVVRIELEDSSSECVRLANALIMSGMAIWHTTEPPVLALLCPNGEEYPRVWAATTASVFAAQGFHASACPLDW